MNLNTTILREISFQLTQGNPWWGMVMANEYIDRSHPLRAVFEMRFAQSIGDAPAGRGTLADALIRGKRQGELSASHAAAVGTRSIRSRKTVPPTFSSTSTATPLAAAARRVPSPHRLAVRQRNSQVARFSSCASTQSRRVAKAAPLQLVAV